MPRLDDPIIKALIVRIHENPRLLDYQCKDLLVKFPHLVDFYKLDQDKKAKEAFRSFWRRLKTDLRLAAADRQDNHAALVQQPSLHPNLMLASQPNFLVQHNRLNQNYHAPTPQVQPVQTVVNHHYHMSGNISPHATTHNTTTENSQPTIMASRVPPLTKEHGKMVLTVALTGNINIKERNPNLPCSPQEIADDIHKCALLGATFFHIHARGEDNKPTMRVEVFREICRLVKERDPEVIIQISTGGRAPPEGVNVDPDEWRMNPLDLMPESGSFTPGSVNLEPIIYKNSPQLVQKLAQKYTETGIKPEIEVFDTNMMHKAEQLIKKGLLKRPVHYGFVMGAPGAQGGDLRQLAHLVSLTAPGDTWSTIGIGKYELPLAATAIAMGGHVRVGLADNNKNADGSLATNESLCKHVVDLAKMMGREIATPAEAREILGLTPEWKDRILPKLEEKMVYPGDHWHIKTEYDSEY